jgi:hypothetical protein
MAYFVGPGSAFQAVVDGAGQAAAIGDGVAGALQPILHGLQLWQRIMFMQGLARGGRGRCLSLGLGLVYSANKSWSAPYLLARGHRLRDAISHADAA